jgi:hypothetical protein
MSSREPGLTGLAKFFKGKRQDLEISPPASLEAAVIYYLEGHHEL